jgi:hypothetical protein
MATAAQARANQANAQHSTGPKSAAGKARAARNSRKHGLTLGVLTLSPGDQPAFRQFEANLHAELNPQGVLEMEAFRQFLDAAARIQKIRSILAAMMDLYAEDPLLIPETEAEIAQLNRYRAAAEMAAYRAVQSLRELQTTRLFRQVHLTPQEQATVPSLVKPPVKLMCHGQMRSRNDRELLSLLYGFPNTNPTEAPTPPGS